jgi:hypothetical protein
LVLSVDSDLSLPKDIDAFAITIENSGVLKYRATFGGLGTRDASLHLPATLTLNGTTRSDDRIRIRLVGLSGGEDGEPRILREAITSVPADRITALSLKLSYACLDELEETSSGARSKCGSGQTCIAGACASASVDGGSLPDHMPAAPGCFDAATCFEEASAVSLDAACSIAPPVDPSGVNVALYTEASGVCTMLGCFVALDADSSEGWRVRADGRIQLPEAICNTRLSSRDALGAIVAPVRAACPRKTSALPTCGPWFDGSPAPTGPRVLADGQRLPSAVRLTNDRVFWANGGIGNEGKWARGSGGTTRSISFGYPAREVSIVGDNGAETLMWAAADLGTETTPPKGGRIYLTDRHGKIDQKGVQYAGPNPPIGVAAVSPTRLFYIEPGPSRSLRHVDFTKAMTQPDAAYPTYYATRIIADRSFVYWINSGTAEIWRYQHTPKPGASLVAAAQSKPTDLAVAIDDPLLPAKALFWTNASSPGSIMRAERPAGNAFGQPIVAELVSGLATPHGIAVFGAHVYWTTRGDGTIMRLPIGASAGTSPETIITGQQAPTRIAVGAPGAMWIADSGVANEGRIVLLPTLP